MRRHDTPPQGSKLLLRAAMLRREPTSNSWRSCDPGSPKFTPLWPRFTSSSTNMSSRSREVRTAQKLKPSLPRLDSLLGLSLGRNGPVSEALPRLEKGFKQSADAEVRRMCGLQLLRAYTGLGRDSDAVETALALNRLYPDDPEVLYHTGRIYGNFAYVVMEKLHDKAPNSIWMLQAQGEANESQKDYDAAIVAFNHVLQIDPQRPGIHYRLGRIYLARFREAQKPEDRDAAAREFTAELGQSIPANGNAAYELAVMQQEQGNLDEARIGNSSTCWSAFPTLKRRWWAWAACCSTARSRSRPCPAATCDAIESDDEVAWYRLATPSRRRKQRRTAEGVGRVSEGSQRQTYAQIL